MSNTLLQKVLTLVPLTETGPEVFVATMITLLSDYFDALESVAVRVAKSVMNSFHSSSQDQCIETNTKRILTHVLMCWN